LQAAFAEASAPSRPFPKKRNFFKPRGLAFFVAATAWHTEIAHTKCAIARQERLTSISLLIAALQGIDRLLTRALRIHLALVRHVEVDRLATGKRPAVIFHTITLSVESRRKPCQSASVTAFVGPGVTVDKGANLEAGATVLNDVKPWMIVIENTVRD
jgi:hypothetical protein